MVEQVRTTPDSTPHFATLSDDDKAIMKKIRSICERGNNAEVKQKKDGTFTVMEVKKHIV